MSPYFCEQNAMKTTTSARPNEYNARFSSQPSKHTRAVCNQRINSVRAKERKTYAPARARDNSHIRTRLSECGMWQFWPQWKDINNHQHARWKENAGKASGKTAQSRTRNELWGSVFDWLKRNHNTHACPFFSIRLDLFIFPIRFCLALRFFKTLHQISIRNSHACFPYSNCVHCTAYTQKSARGGERKQDRGEKSAMQQISTMYVYALRAVSVRLCVCVCAKTISIHDFSSRLAPCTHSNVESLYFALYYCYYYSSSSVTCRCHTNASYVHAYVRRHVHTMNRTYVLRTYIRSLRFGRTHRAQGAAYISISHKPIAAMSRPPRVTPRPVAAYDSAVCTFVVLQQLQQNPNDCSTIRYIEAFGSFAWTRLSVGKMCCGVAFWCRRCRGRRRWYRYRFALRYFDLPRIFQNTSTGAIWFGRSTVAWYAQTCAHHLLAAWQQSTPHSALHLSADTASACNSEWNESDAKLNTNCCLFFYSLCICESSVHACVFVGAVLCFSLIVGCGASVGLLFLAFFRPFGIEWREQVRGSEVECVCAWCTVQRIAGDNKWIFVSLGCVSLGIFY